MTRIVSAIQEDLKQNNWEQIANAASLAEPAKEVAVPCHITFLEVFITIPTVSEESRMRQIYEAH